MGGRLPISRTMIPWRGWTGIFGRNKRRVHTKWGFGVCDIFWGWESWGQWVYIPWVLYSCGERGGGGEGVSSENREYDMRRYAAVAQYQL